jgi:hypothetical protein
VKATRIIWAEVARAQAEAEAEADLCGATLMETESRPSLLGLGARQHLRQKGEDVNRTLPSL